MDDEEGKENTKESWKKKNQIFFPFTDSIIQPPPALPVHAIANVNYHKELINRRSYEENDTSSLLDETKSNYSQVSKKSSTMDMNETDTKRFLKSLKNDHLSFIHAFDPEFQFKELQQQSNCNIQDQINYLNEQFFQKCDSFTKLQEKLALSEEEKSKDLQEKINELNELTKNANGLALEIGEAIKKAEKDLYIDSDIVYKSYQELKAHLYSYFKNQSDPIMKALPPPPPSSSSSFTENSNISQSIEQPFTQNELDSMIQDRVNQMIQILLDHIIKCNPFEATMKPIENLFQDSKHENWILPTKKQMVTALLLDQEQPIVDIQFIMTAFEKEHCMALKPDHDLLQAILVSHQLSKYGVAADAYFKSGLTLQGLEGLELKDTDKSELSVDPQLQKRPQSIVITLDPPPHHQKQQQHQQPVPPLPSKQYQNVVTDNRPPPPRHTHSHTLIPFKHKNKSSISSERPKSINIDSQQHHQQQQQEQEIYMMKQWRQHLLKGGKKEECGCLYCQKRLKHKTFFGSTSTCTKKDECYEICMIRKEHKDKGCKYNVTDAYCPPKCRQCIKLSDILIK